MKILYVEDNDDNIYMLKNRLSRAFSICLAPLPIMIALAHTALFIKQTRPAEAQCRGWRERAQAGHPAGLVRGVERLHRLPAHAGVPQHRWGAFLNDPSITWR